MIIDVPGDESLQTTLDRARRSGRATYLVRGTTKHDLLASFAKALSFDDYFGMNLDALADSLTELDPELRAAIIWDDAASFASADPRAFTAVRHILGSRLPDDVDVLLCLR